ncbi:type IV pilus modification PilV family protein [Cryobacterium glucosi]|uniref:Type II secretion system protein n=1 Tax=Cryobacterium glucosi TaxID=1259175 RepID=A0ABY2IMB8_9MICO|nr:type II secretion system protein [Cryobacterium glucosi]TFC20574.1 type II secretion system protein [Cryobacterium glucosi]
MKALRDRITAREGRDQGLTLVEILVAMMVFAIIAVSVAYSLTLALALVNDARAREVAANLAAQELDLDRAAADVFTLVDTDKTLIVNQTTFHLHRDVSWITSTGVDANCGSGGGQLQYKRLNVSVTWDGMRAATNPVRSDTVVAPGSKINDPTLGTILVSVLTASGNGSSGVTVTAIPSVPANGAVAITDVPDPTDAQGCSYVLKVVPGNYDVKISRANSVDVNQAATSTTTVGVAAGAAASVAFQYDLPATFTAKYGVNYTSGSTLIPNNLDTTVRSTYGVYTTSATTNALSRVISLHPFTSGYEPIAGKYVPPAGTAPTCLSPDPARWIIPAADGAIGHTPSAVSALPGGAADLPVPMGIAAVTGLSGKYLKAVSQATAPLTGDPGCSVTTTYTFGALGSGNQQIGLPYGSWLLYWGTSTGQTTLVPATSITTLNRGVVGATGVVTFDPRTVVP